MQCKKCNVKMSISGTVYEPKRNKGSKGYRRYDECPICRYRKYHNGWNCQEVLDKGNQRMEGFLKWNRN